MRRLRLGVLMTVAALLGALLGRVATAGAGERGGRDAREACLRVQAVAQALVATPDVMRPAPAVVRRQMDEALAEGLEAARLAPRRWRSLASDMRFADAELTHHAELAGVLGARCYAVLDPDS